MIKYVNDQIQTFKKCCVCGCEREYDYYHRLYVACKKCAKHYQKNREKIFKKAKSYRENNKDKLKQNRRTASSHKDDIQHLYNQNNILTQMVKTSVSVS